MKIRIDILTLFPELIDAYANEGMMKRAQEKKIAKISAYQIRNFATGKHHKVDDRPFGGGAGMVMKVEPIFYALKTIKAKPKTARSKIILLSPRGTPFDQRMAERLSKLDRLVLLCGRYEGVDERVSKYLIDEEVSVGSFILTGGELGALMITDAVTRLLPGVLGNDESAAHETFSGPEKKSKLNISNQASYLEHPHYTRPEIFSPNARLKWVVPKILLSGDHKKIKAWREKESLKLAKKHKPSH